MATGQYTPLQLINKRPPDVQWNSYMLFAKETDIDDETLAHL